MVREAFSTMDVYLQKRYDLIPNLVETVKGYAKHEKETLDAVISARNMATSASTPEQTMEAQGEISNALGRLFALAESYPDLKANTNFLDLQGQLEKVEADIANARTYYNGVVKSLNTKIESFPSNIIAGMFHITQEPFYEVESSEMRKNVKVEF
jgi:LemA protein